jgi:AraC family transcriptional regulator
MEGQAVADYPRGAWMASRVIDDFEFVWMLRGQARILFGDDELMLSPGELLLVPPRLRHEIRWDPRRPSRHGYVHFEPEHVDGRPEIGLHVRRMTRHDPLAGLCAYLLWLGRERSAGWEREARRTLGFLLGVFADGPLPDEHAPAALPAPLSDVLHHLRRQWSEMPLRRVSVAELAAVAHVSRSYLNRLFQAEFGVGVASGLDRIRCFRAETLLTRTDMKITSIAHECGFADLYHFSHRFKRLHGVSPSAYRAAASSVTFAMDHPGVRRLAFAISE